MAENEAPHGGRNDSNALTKKIGPLPIWVWMALVFVIALGIAYVKRGGKGAGGTDPETGLPTGSGGDLQARQSLQQLQAAAQRSGSAAGGAQTPPTIIQNYPASTTIAFPVRGSRFGNNGSPSWPIHARQGGPGPRGPGHKPWEHGRHHGHWNGGEPHHGGGGPGAGEHEHHHQGMHHDHHGDRPNHDHHGGGEHHEENEHHEEHEHGGGGGDHDHGGGRGGGGDHGGHGGGRGGGHGHH